MVQKARADILPLSKAAGLINLNLKNNQSQKKVNFGIPMLLLMLAGESIFLLPFVLPRVFRPTVLEVFNLTNLELGQAFSVYGVVALIAYFMGGPIADRYSARKLLAFALCITALGGVVLRSIPNSQNLQFLYAFWGFSTILLFWAAMLRYVRVIGGNIHQGSAYGLLDAGRGLLAALLSSISIWIFAMLLPDSEIMVTFEAKKQALITIIESYAILVFLLGILVWFFIPEPKNTGDANFSQRLKFSEIKKVISIRQVWINSMIVLCAYVGYKCTDDFSLYAYDVFGYDDIEAAQVGNISFWIRPLAALIAGFLADRHSGSKIILIGFLITIAASISIALGISKNMDYLFLIINVAVASLGIYGVRGVYFSLFNEAKIPFHWTGTAIGIISVIGFTPDIFMGPIMGYLLDTYPGTLGHQFLFGILSLFSLLGLIAILHFRKKLVRK